jgi:hypothetical protein
MTTATPSVARITAAAPIAMVVTPPPRSALEDVVVDPVVPRAASIEGTADGR